MTKQTDMVTGTSKLRQLQALPLDKKIQLSLDAIECWHEAWSGDVYISLSGGKDSTVVRHLVHCIFPGVLSIFVNTGMEFPEIVSFVKMHDNVKIVRPKMPFHKVIEKWGYPVISKRTAQYIHEVKNAKGETATKRLRLTGINSAGQCSNLSMISKKWQYLCDAPFKISHRCCFELKKKPFAKIEKDLVPYTGMMAGDGSQREMTYLQHGGCNQYGIKSPKSNPLAFWMESDIWEYIRRFNVPYSSIYDMGYERTGCVFCLFGVHLEHKRTGTNRIIRLQETHPKLWKYCVHKLGIGKVMDYINVPYEDKQLKIF